MCVLPLRTNESADIRIFLQEEDAGWHHRSMAASQDVTEFTAETHAVISAAGIDPVDARALRTWLRSAAVSSAVAIPSEPTQSAGYTQSGQKSAELVLALARRHGPEEYVPQLSRIVGPRECWAMARLPTTQHRLRSSALRLVFELHPDPRVITIAGWRLYVDRLDTPGLLAIPE